MQREQGQSAGDPRHDRKRYNLQIWSGGFAILLLLVIFAWLMHMPALRAVMPFLVSTIGLVVAGVALWVGVVSHRDAAAVRRLNGALLANPQPASWRQLANPVELAVWEKAIVGAALILVLILAALFEFYPATSLWQNDFFRAGLALAVSGVAALSIHLFAGPQTGSPGTLVVQGGGALIVFVLILYITKLIVPS